MGRDARNRNGRSRYRRRRATFGSLLAGIGAIGLSAVALANRPVENGDRPASVTTLASSAAQTAPSSPATSSTTIATVTPMTVEASVPSSNDAGGSTAAEVSADPTSGIDPDGTDALVLDQPLPVGVDDPFAPDPAIARFDMAVRVPQLSTIAGIRPSSNPAAAASGRQIVRFDETGNGNLFTANTATGEVQIITPSGAIDQWTIAPSDLNGSIFDAALGPDRVLYVSRSPLNAFGQPTAFTLVAYELSALQPEELRRWPTNWKCDPGACGTITFSERNVGHLFGSSVNYMSTVIAPILALPVVEPLPTTIESATCGESTSADFGIFRSKVTYLEVTWEIEAACTAAINGFFGTYFSQRDGSVATLIDVSSRSADPPRELLVWLLADGERRVYDVSDLNIVGLTVSDDRLLGARLIDNGNIELLEISAPD